MNIVPQLFEGKMFGKNVEKRLTDHKNVLHRYLKVHFCSQIIAFTLYFCKTNSV